MGASRIDATQLCPNLLNFPEGQGVQPDLSVRAVVLSGQTLQASSVELFENFPLAQGAQT
jgi:hypothetical protein